MNIKIKNKKNIVYDLVDLLFYLFFPFATLIIVEYIINPIYSAQICMSVLIIYYFLHIFLKELSKIHIIHHFVTFFHHLLIAFIFPKGITKVFLRIMLIQYIMLLTSFFNSLRKIALKKSWPSAAAIEKIYSYFFIFVKVFGNITGWILWFYYDINKLNIVATKIHYYLIMIIGGFIQMIFCYMVYNKIK